MADPNASTNQRRDAHREPAVASARASWIFSVLYGSLLGLALLKFGNPVVLDRLIEPPRDLLEYLFQPWPLRWGYLLLGACAVFGLIASRSKRQLPPLVFIVPVIWFLWQLLSVPESIAPALSQATLRHFAGCLACFFLGLFCLSTSKSLRPFWVGVTAAFLLVLWMGFEQHYGGLEATRKMFFQQPDWQQYPADYIKKIQSNRIFSTLVYPNALAAAIVLILPALLAATWRMTSRLTEITRGVLVGAVAYSALACLFWSGSKSGWLVGMVLVLIVLLRQPLSRRLRFAIVLGVVVVGLAAFFIKFAPYFRRGAPSVSARFEYWRAATHTALAHPIFGTGPGSFSAAFRKIKPPDAEMALLVHNDYLEQASDSGWVGFLSYTAFVVGSIFLLARKEIVWRDPELFLIWLGLVGWAMQSFVEFLLYIPALAWPAFTFLGLLWSRAAVPIQTLTAKHFGSTSSRLADSG